jgi:hypothetical protein
MPTIHTTIIPGTQMSRADAIDACALVTTQVQRRVTRFSDLERLLACAWFADRACDIAEPRSRQALQPFHARVVDIARTTRRNTASTTAVGAPQSGRTLRLSGRVTPLVQLAVGATHARARLFVTPSIGTLPGVQRIRFGKRRSAGLAVRHQGLQHVDAFTDVEWKGGRAATVGERVEARLHALVAQRESPLHDLFVGLETARSKLSRRPGTAPVAPILIDRLQRSAVLLERTDLRIRQWGRPDVALSIRHADVALTIRHAEVAGLADIVVRSRVGRPAASQP